MNEEAVVMAKEPRDQQKTDAQRIGDKGTGKLDQHAPPMPDTDHSESRDVEASAVEVANLDELRQRIEAERARAIAQLEDVRVAPDVNDESPRPGPDTVFEEGDEAQASERHDMILASRERLAKRINRLAAALERIARGTYGRCEMCGRPIEAQRLAALPEAPTCFACQHDLETRRRAA